MVSRWADSMADAWDAWKGDSSVVDLAGKWVLPKVASKVVETVER